MRPTKKDLLAKALNRPVTEFLTRSDGRIEWLCEHGVGHTIWYPQGSDAVHGCDGCCKIFKEHKEEIKNELHKIR